jgi:hypothetical protein
MNFEEFSQTLSLTDPPEGLSAYLRSLWYDAKDDWERAHTIIQDINDSSAAWIHAYLHRKEGDNGNADYWYRRARRKRTSETLEQEWETISRALLAG